MLAILPGELSAHHFMISCGVMGGDRISTRLHCKVGLSVEYSVETRQNCARAGLPFKLCSSSVLSILQGRSDALGVRTRGTFEEGWRQHSISDRGHASFQNPDHRAYRCRYITQLSGDGERWSEVETKVVKVDA